MHRFDPRKQQKIVKAATHAIKIGFNLYAGIFLHEAIKAKKVTGASQFEIQTLKKTLDGLKD